MKALVLASTLSCLALVTTPAAAADPHPGKANAADEQKALDLFATSRARYREGKFQDAAELVRQAYGLTREPVLLFNLGRALEGAGDLAAAADAYAAYLAADPKASDRRAIEERIRTLRSLMAERVALRQQREDALAREAVAKRDAQRPTLPLWLPMASGVVTAGAFGAGVIFGVVSGNEEDQARREPVQARAADDLASARTFATYANVAFVAGGALAITTVVLLVVRQSGTNRSAVTLNASGSDVSLRGTF